MNYYPFHIGDYLSATRHLSWEEDAAYRRLLDTYYTTEKALPLDLRAVCRLVLATTETQREAVSVVLSEFFERTDAGWINSRADAEILAMREKQQKQRERANKRWQKPAAEHGNAPAMPRHEEPDAAASKTDANAMPPTPTPTPTPTPVNTPNGVGVPRKRSTTTALAARPDDVSEPVWQDFQRLRREKRAPLTDTALAGVRREAGKAGVSMETALAYCCEAGWQGFNAGWYADRQGAGGRGVAAQAVETYAQRAARQRMEEVAPMAARKQPGSAFDAAQRFMQGEVIDVAAVPKQLARVV